jgi:hypothetical protein
MVTNGDMNRIKKDRGPEDLTLKIEMLTKQKEYLQKKCREAGEAILKQEGKYISLEKEYDKVCEERDNFVTMLGDGKDDTR